MALPPTNRINLRHKYPTRNESGYENDMNDTNTIATMDTLFSDIILSPLFHFHVGPNAQRFTIHSLAFSRLSQPLNTLINGDMREARERVAVWDDMEPAIFALLAEYAYEGQLSLPTKKLDQQHILRKAAGDKKKSRSEDAVPTDNFNQQFREHVESFGHSAFPKPVQARREKCSGQTLDTATFLLYMKLYVTADKYLIVSLQQQILYQINLWLLDRPPVGERWITIEGLRVAITYIYSTTLQDDQMRRLLAFHTAKLFKGREDQLKDVMEDCGEFSFLVAHYLQRRDSNLSWMTTAMAGM
ncbi:hypothetical protein GGR57DRAFT_510922 [Xylariaceae sp. FL1272]|nr:hypothetical protein GGR57DRAFT_510922 [Xylariaceae sp. FL1272]